MAKKTAAPKEAPLQIQAEGATGSKTWSGHITIGPISIPVAMFAAARGESMGFNMLHSVCQGRIKRVDYCPCCAVVDVLKDFEYVPKREMDAYVARVKNWKKGDPKIEEPAEIVGHKGDRLTMHADDVLILELEEKVGKSEALALTKGDEILKGYEYAKDTYAVFTKDEIDALKPESGKFIQIEKFVKVSEVHPLYLESSYYLPASDPAGVRAYAMLREGLLAENAVAVGKVCIRQSENIVFIFPHPGGGLLAFTAYMTDEVRKVAFNSPPQISPEELSVVRQFIVAKSGPLDMAEYRDEYRDSVMLALEAKKKGEAVKVAEAPKAKPADTGNLIEMFKASTAIALEKNKSKKPPKGAVA